MDNWRLLLNYHRLSFLWFVNNLWLLNQNRLSIHYRRLSELLYHYWQLSELLGHRRQRPCPTLTLSGNLRQCNKILMSLNLWWWYTTTMGLDHTVPLGGVIVKNYVCGFLLYRSINVWTLQALAPVGLVGLSLLMF